MIAQIARVMAEGGRLILNGPAFPVLHGRRDAALGHLRRYTRRQFRALIERHGFQIELIRPWNFTALPMYVLIEGILRMGVLERSRHGRRGSINRVANRLLRWWYTSIENRLVLPSGLSLFVIASKRSDP